MPRTPPGRSTPRQPMAALAHDGRGDGWPRYASLTLAPLPASCSYRSDRSLCGTGAGTRRRQLGEEDASPLSGGLVNTSNSTHTAEGDPRPHHCPAQRRVCPVGSLSLSLSLSLSSSHTHTRTHTQGVSAVSLKQRKAIKLYSRLTSTPEPDIDAMDFTDAARCASLALPPLPVIFSYNSEKSLCGAGG